MDTILFDLDNTLYDATQYYYGAFKDISLFISQKYKTISEADLFENLKNIWHEKTSMYSYIMDDALRPLGLEDEISKSVRIFNDHDELLKPYDDVIETLKKLKDLNKALGVVTDGCVERQKRKIKILDIEHFFDVIIYTKEIGESKPSSKPFTLSLSLLKRNPENSIYVGDNPFIDFDGAKKAGMWTARILRGEFATFKCSENIDFTIDSLDNLFRICDEIT